MPRRGSTADEAEPDVEEDPVAAFKAQLRSQLGDWYVIHSYAGYENRVKANLENRRQSLNMEDYIYAVEVPMEEVVEIKNAQRKVVKRVRIPGYVLVRMDLTDESWGAVRHTPGVTGFVGHTHQPVPLTLDEVFSMLAPSLEPKTPTTAASAAQGRLADQGRLHHRRVGHRHRRPVRHLAGDDLGDQRREPEAQGARLHLRPGDPGRAVLQPGRQDLTGTPSYGRTLQPGHRPRRRPTTRNGCTACPRRRRSPA